MWSMRADSEGNVGFSHETAVARSRLTHNNTRVLETFGGALQAVMLGDAGAVS
jgi:hypothetical protein